MSSGVVQIGHSVTSFLPGKTRQSVQFHPATRSNLNTRLFDALTASSKPSHHPRRSSRSSLLQLNQESCRSWFPCRPTRKSAESNPRTAGFTNSMTTVTAASAEAVTTCTATTTTTMTTTSSLAFGSKRSGCANPCLTEAQLPECRIPQPVFALFVYLAQRGVHVNDLFRRPGNITQMKHILQQFATGHSINWSDYNVYTVANVAKKVLLAIPGGLLGPSGEKKLLATATFATVADAEAAAEQVYRLDPSAGQLNRTSRTDDHRTAWLCKPLLVPPPPPPPPSPTTVTTTTDNPGDDPCHTVRNVSWPRGSMQQLHQLSEVAERRIAVFLRILEGLPPSHKQLAILVFGILHQMVFHAASTAERSACNMSGESAHSNESRDTAPEPRVPLLTLAEGVVKSVAGTLFHTCSASVLSVEQTAQVLRSLVLCFPAMGEPITQFYVSAVRGHLRFSSLTGTGMTMEKATCALCPKSAHSTYFGPHDSPNDSRSCPFGLIQAASRLFCLNSSSTPSSDSGSPLHMQLSTGKPLSSTPGTHRIRFRCPPFSAKSRDSSPPTGPDQVPPSVIITQSSSPVTSLCSGGSGVADQMHVDHSTAPVPTPQDEDHLMAMVQPPIKVQIDAPPETKHVTTLRRHQSRYRSLKRRQMENLSRRAEWFLSPTTVPIVNLCPIVTQPGLWEQSNVVQSASDVNLSSQAPQKHGIVVTSTVSLLELGNTIDPESMGEADRCHLMAKDILPAVQPPRLLFTASTGELEQGECGEPAFRMEPTHPAVSDCAETTSSRQRLISVGSCLTPFPSSSFVSIHSAPSADLARIMRSDRVNYFHSPSLPPSSPDAEKARSSSSVEQHQTPNTTMERIYQQSHPSMTSLQRPLLVGHPWCDQNCCCPCSSAKSRRIHVASCSVFTTMSSDVSWPSMINPTMLHTTCSARDQLQPYSERLRRNSDLAAFLSRTDHNDY